MEKPRNIPKPDSNTTNKIINNFARKTAKLEKQKKAPIFESNLKNKDFNWIKKPNDSWDY